MEAQTSLQITARSKYGNTLSFKPNGIGFTNQGWKNPLIRSPWRAPHTAGRVEILIVCNVNYRISNTYGHVGRVEILRIFLPYKCFSSINSLHAG